MFKNILDNSNWSINIVWAESGSLIGWDTLFSLRQFFSRANINPCILYLGDVTGRTTVSGWTWNHIAVQYLYKQIRTKYPERIFFLLCNPAGPTWYFLAYFFNMYNKGKALKATRRGGDDRYIQYKPLL